MTSLQKLLWIRTKNILASFDCPASIHASQRPLHHHRNILIDKVHTSSLSYIAYLLLMPLVPLYFPRTLGGTIGIAIGDTIYASELRRRLPTIQGYEPAGGDSATNDVAGLSHIEVSSILDFVIRNLETDFSRFCFLLARCSPATSAACLRSQSFHHLVSENFLFVNPNPLADISLQIGSFWFHYLPLVSCPVSHQSRIRSHSSRLLLTDYDAKSIYLVLLIRNYSLKRNVVQMQKTPKAGEGAIVTDEGTETSVEPTAHDSQEGEGKEDFERQAASS